MITRITKLKGFNAVLMGRDLANIFKEGHVYDVKEVLGVITVTDLGEHARSEDHSMSIGEHATSGTYCLTKKEHEAQLQAQNY